MKRIAAVADRLDVIVPVRLTRAERDHLDLSARDVGLRLSPFIRRILLDRPLPPRRQYRPIPEINRQAYVELNRIGGNLNLLVRNLQAVSGPEVTVQACRHELLELGEALIRMQRQLAAIDLPDEPPAEPGR